MKILKVLLAPIQRFYKRIASIPGEAFGYARLVEREVENLELKDARFIKHIAFIPGDKKLQSLGFKPNGKRLQTTHRTNKLKFINFYLYDGVNRILWHTEYLNMHLKCNDFLNIDKSALWDYIGTIYTDYPTQKMMYKKILKMFEKHAKHFKTQDLRYITNFDKKYNKRGNIKLLPFRPVEPITVNNIPLKGATVECVIDGKEDKMVFIDYLTVVGDVVYSIYDYYGVFVLANNEFGLKFSLETLQFYNASNLDKAVKDFTDFDMFLAMHRKILWNKSLWEYRHKAPIAKKP